MKAGSRGQALVEFAFVLPIFLLCLMGVVDMGRLIYMNSVLSQAAREGARLASVEASWINSSNAACNAVDGPVCPVSVAALAANAQAAANRMVTPFATVTTVYISCDSSGNQPTSASWTGTTCARTTPGEDLVSVRVVLTFTPLTPIIGQFIGPVTTSGSATMVIN